MMPAEPGGARGTACLRPLDCLHALAWDQKQQRDDAAMTIDGGEDPDRRVLESGETVSNQLRA